MSGTKAGGQKARETNYKRHGQDFYRTIGAKGGRNGHEGGFASDHERARLAGAKGGRKSKRNNEIKKQIKQKENEILRMIYIENVPISQVAEKLNIPYGSLYYWLRRGGRA